MFNEKSKSFDVWLLIIGVLIFTYTLSRAFLISITWDEAYTYLEFIRKGIVMPDEYVKMSANNHLLNTWLDIRLTNWFGVSEFVLRIPSLLGHLLFLFYSAKLVSNFGNRKLIIASFLIINVNPYILDFFSLARGYGLSFGLIMASIYYLYLFVNSEKKQLFSIVSIVFACFGSLANFVIVNYCVALFTLIMLLIFIDALRIKNDKIRERLVLLKTTIVPTIIILLFLLFVLPVILHLKEVGALFYGGNKSFWADTISETINANFYALKFNIILHWILKAFVLLVVIASIMFLVSKLRKKQFFGNKKFISSLLFLIGLCTLSIIIQHLLLGTLYLTDRTALFLVILFNLLLVFLVNELSKENKQTTFIAYLSSVFIIIQFIYSFNFNYVEDWKFDATTKDMVVDLEKIQKTKDSKGNLKLFSFLENSPSIDFYIETKNLKWLTCESLKENFSMNYDYLYLSEKDYNKINKDSVEIIKSYPVTNNILVKVKGTK